MLFEVNKMIIFLNEQEKVITLLNFQLNNNPVQLCSKVLAVGTESFRFISKTSFWPKKLHLVFFNQMILFYLIVSQRIFFQFFFGKRGFPHILSLYMGYAVD